MKYTVISDNLSEHISFKLRPIDYRPTAEKFVEGNDIA